MLNRVRLYCIFFIAIYSTILMPAAKAQACPCNGLDRLACQARCENAAQLEKSRRELQEEIPKDVKTVVPAYVAARDRIRKTSPNDPQFTANFEAYRTARMARDDALMRQLMATFNVSNLFGQNQNLALLDDAYEMPREVRQEWHAYAAKKLTQIMVTGNLNASVSGSNYPYLIDTGELQYYARQHNMPLPSLAPGRVVVPKSGDRIDYELLSARDRATTTACLKDARETYPGNWKNYANQKVAREAEAYLKACITKSCDHCYW